MSSPLLEVKDLQVTVGEENKVLLDGLNLTVNPGETHVLMGHNGAGKSTLMSALMGDPRYNVTRGQIIFKGQDVTHEPAPVCSYPSRRRRKSPASRWKASGALRRLPLPVSPSRS